MAQSQQNFAPLPDAEMVTFSNSALLSVYCTLRQGMYGKYSSLPEGVPEGLYLTIDLKMSPILTSIMLMINNLIDNKLVYSKGSVL